MLVLENGILKVNNFKSCRIKIALKPKNNSTYIYK